MLAKTTVVDSVRALVLLIMLLLLIPAAEQSKSKSKSKGRNGECVSLRRQRGNLVRSAGKDFHAWMISPRPGTRSDPRPSLRCPAPSILG